MGPRIKLLSLPLSPGETAVNTSKWLSEEAIGVLKKCLKAAVLSRAILESLRTKDPNDYFVLTADFVDDHFPLPPESLCRIIGSNALILPRLVRNSVAIEILIAGIKDEIREGNEDVELLIDDGFNEGDPVPKPVVDIEKFLGHGAIGTEMEVSRIAA